MLEKQKPRLDFLDNLKIALTMLVVTHHAGQPYGGSSGWWYMNSKQTTNLGHFFAVNAGFFMSLFFLISAYFLPASFEKKGSAKFLKDRLKRFGIPLLVGFLILMPILMYSYYLHFRNYPKISFGYYYFHVFFGMGPKPEHWTGPSWPDMQFGHLWFIEHLLVYAILYTVFHMLFKHSKHITSRLSHTPSNWMVLIFAVFVSLLTFVVRIWYPIDHWIGVLGFIQAELAHVPQYACCFIVGILAYRNNWIVNLPAKVGMVWLAIGLVLALFMYTGSVQFYAQGGFNLRSLEYSFYETFLCAGLCVGLIYFFREYINGTGRVVKFLAANAFSVYIFHVAVVVALQYILAPVNISGMEKFLIVSLLGILLTYGISHFIIRKIPYFGKLL